MSAQDDPRIARLKRELHTRVRRRKDSGGYYLDLRRTRLRGGVVALRDPSHPEWPDLGRTARTKVTALEYVDTYVDRLGSDWIRGVEPERTTVNDWAAPYLDHLLATKGREISTYSTRSSNVRKHVGPGEIDQRGGPRDHQRNLAVRNGWNASPMGGTDRHRPH